MTFELFTYDDDDNEFVYFECRDLKIYIINH